MTSKFPTTETFLIDWLGGTCGAFITMLMYNILFPEHEVEISPTYNGAAHTNQNIIANRLHKFNKLFDKTDWGHSYKFVDPIFPSKPLILYDHEVPNLDEFFDKFPIGKIIVIRISNKMIPLLIGNFFYKTVMDFDYTSNKNSFWENMRNKDSSLKEYDNPNNLPDELLGQILKQQAKNYKIENYYSEQYIPPEEYSDRIYFIDFYDIIFNKTKVLSQLSDITNRPITDFVNDQYDIYLAKQKELIDTKLAWIDLEG